jgi:long-chain acyl-CoA synthetase
MRALLAALLVASAASAQGVEVQSVKLPDRARLAEGDSDLLLNGAGVRKRFFVNVYVGALYLPRKVTTAEGVLADGSPRRFAMLILRDEISAEQLLGSLHDGLEANNTPADLAAVSAGIKQLDGIFAAVKAVKKDSVVLLDYLPDAGTRVTVNSENRGVIPGAAFNRALLKVWLGEKPVDADLKKALLGSGN